MHGYPKIKMVIPFDDYRLQVTFANDVSKVYDCRLLLQNPVFAPLAKSWLFRAVQVDPGGYGVSWNEEIDLSESELWEHGTRIESTPLIAVPA